MHEAVYSTVEAAVSDDLKGRAKAAIHRDNLDVPHVAADRAAVGDRA